MTKEDLQQIAELMDAKLAPVLARIDEHGKILEEQGKIIQALAEDASAIKEDVAAIKEDAEITRVAVNALGEWADNVAVVTAVTYPVKHKQAE